MNRLDAYMPVSLNTILVNTNVGCDLYLKTCENNEINYILYCAGTNAFTQDKISGLKKNKIENLYIHKHDHKIYLKYLEPCLKKIINDENINNIEKAQAVYNVAKNIMEDVFSDPRSGTHVWRAKNWVSNTVDIIIRDKMASAIINVLSFDYYTYTHSVNVAVLGLLFSRYLNLKIEDINAFGLGLLLHDIGKIYVASDILNKREKLTNEEFLKVKIHQI